MTDGTGQHCVTDYGFEQGGDFQLVSAYNHFNEPPSRVRNALSMWTLSCVLTSLPSRIYFETGEYAAGNASLTSI